MAYICYDLRLGSDCNLDKNLSKKVGMSQLVKCKDTRLYLQLYILIDYKIRKQYLLYEAMTKTNYGTADYCIIRRKF